MLMRASLLEPELRQAILVMSRAGELRKKLRKNVVKPSVRATQRTALVRGRESAMVSCELKELEQVCL